MRDYTQIKKTRLNLTGVKFGRLTVERLLGSYKNQHYWLCACVCGNKIEAPSGSLRSGNTQSCGCAVTEKTVARVRTHGMSGTRTYGMWHRMIQRCEDKKCSDYKYYGARGIDVCEEWHDFAVFLRDVGERPCGMTLDRIDNDRGYRPGNVRWATRAEQMRNTRLCKNIEFLGQTKILSEWAHELGIKPRTLSARLRTLGYSVEDAFTKDVKSGRMLNGKTWAENKKGKSC